MRTRGGETVPKPWIQLKHVSYYYPNTEKNALLDVNVTLYHGDKILVLGANGSGKSTFLKVLQDQLPKEGDLSGQVIHFDEGEEADTPQTEPLEEKKVTDAWLSRTAVAERWHSIVNQHASVEDIQELSSGEKEILRMARQLQARRDVYIFDEPLKRLSPERQQIFVDIIDDFHVHTNATIIIAEHQLEQMMTRPIDSVLVFSEGRIVYDGSLDKLLTTNILTALEIREPLYITAMRYAGYPLHQVYNISHVDQLFGRQLRQIIQNWMAMLPRFRYDASTEPLLQLDDVSVLVNSKYQRGLFHLNLTIHKGDLVSMVGKNGSGKTLLAKLLSGSLPAESGNIYWRGREISTEDLSKEVGYVSKCVLEYDKGDTVYSYMEKYAEKYGDKESDDIEQALEKAGLLIFKDCPLERLSAISKQKMLIAQALLPSPQLLVVEELTAGYDFEHFREIMRILYRLNKKYQVAVILTTHDIEVMLEYTRRTLVLLEGKLVADALPIDIVTIPRFLKKAGLRESSLTKFAKRLDLVDPYTFITKFMDYDREMQQGPHT